MGMPPRSKVYVDLGDCSRRVGVFYSRLRVDVYNRYLDSKFKVFEGVYKLIFRVSNPGYSCSNTTLRCREEKYPCTKNLPLGE